MNLPNSDNDREVDPSQWVDEFGDYLFRYAMVRLRSAEAAEEVVQQTFVAGFRHRQQFSGRGTLRGWLLGILKRKIIDYVRQQRRAQSSQMDDDPDAIDHLFDERGMWANSVKSKGWKPLDSLERAEFWHILKGCLDALPDRQAAVFTLRTMDDKSTEEICKDLEISASNLWVLLHRARLRLATCLNERWNEE